MQFKKGAFHSIALLYACSKNFRTFLHHTTIHMLIKILPGLMIHYSLAIPTDNRKCGNTSHSCLRFLRCWSPTSLRWAACTSNALQFTWVTQSAHQSLASGRLYIGLQLCIQSLTPPDLVLVVVRGWS